MCNAPGRPQNLITSWSFGAMDSSEYPRIFVGGISCEADEEILRDHFSKYGGVIESVIIRDRNTGVNRGFGFVLFCDPSSADKALQDKHVISGRTLDVKRAVPRDHQHNGTTRGNTSNNNGSSCNGNNHDQNSSNDAHLRTKKIFVGGLPSNLTEEEFRAYFEKFGRTTDAVVMYDSVTHRPRGFGFITFDSEDAVDNVIHKSYHELNDKLVEVKRAVPKDGNFRNQCNSSTRNSSGSGGYSNNYAHGMYPSYDPRYGFYPWYMLSPAFSGYGTGRPWMYPVPIVGGDFARHRGYGVYSVGSYGRIPQQSDSYAAGFTNRNSFRPPRSPWNGAGIISPTQSPGHFGNPIYSHPSIPCHGYMNGSSFATTNPGSTDTRGPPASSNGRLNHASKILKSATHVNGEVDSAPQTEDDNLDRSSSGLTGNCGFADIRNQECSDSCLRPYLDRVG